jgi:hypothetical protein
VVEAGFADGVHDVALLRPTAGDQEQETPPEPARGVDTPAQMLAEPDAAAVGGGWTVTVALAVFVEPQPAALVTTNE